MIQTELDFSRQLTNAAIKQAVDHADQVHDGWSEKAYGFLLQFISIRSTFMVEEVREYAGMFKIPDPPSQRAWGSVIRRAVIAGLVVRDGYEQVKNPTSHRANATRWRVC